MATQTESGQVVIELALLSALLVGFFLLAVSISDTAHDAISKNRFPSPKRGALRSRP